MPTSFRAVNEPGARHRRHRVSRLLSEVVPSLMRHRIRDIAPLATPSLMD